MKNAYGRNAAAQDRTPAWAGLLAAAMLICAGLPRTGWSQEGDAGARLESDIQKAKSEIVQARKDGQKAEAELRKTDSLLREENARAAQSEDRQAKDRERREKENTALQARLQETQAKIN